MRVSETDALRKENEDLRRRLTDAEAALRALSLGEIDSIATEALATPTLLRAAQTSLRQSQQLFRSVFDGSRDALLLALSLGVGLGVPSQPKLFACCTRSGIMSPTITIAAPSR